ncbi:MAG: efflux RND transporter permease subunit [Gammaproteobacteria bacterium]
MLERLYRNHVLANLVFALVLVMGSIAYVTMPREQDPTINFNWIDITTIQAGASAEDMEKRVTEVLEDAIRTVSDVKFVSSNSREAVSSVLVRFNDDIDAATFDKRLTDLRREIQNEEQDLPEEAESPVIFEVTSANAFPVATLAVISPGDDENLRKQAEIVKKALERIKGVDRILDSGLNDPELQVLFLPERLESLDVSPVDLSDTVRQFYRDVAAGTARVNDQNWAVRLSGTDSDPNYLARLPITTARGEVPLGSVAEVGRGREKASKYVRLNGQPAVMLAVTKQGYANTLKLVARVKEYIAKRNRFSASTGVELVLVDDQTQITRDALRIMQTNAMLGLLLVLAVAWVFLGTRIALLTSIGIPFILAGTFWFLDANGHTLNVTVLLGVVISLGMLVDDAVVVVEAIYYRLQRGMAVMEAALAALKEVFAPVTTAVLTTMAAFLPLMLLPGILGKFMFIIPMVVTVALAVSLVEAYWMLPAHLIAARVSFTKPSRVRATRNRFLHWIRVKYTKLLLKVLRRPKTTLVGILLILMATLGAAFSGQIKVDFFASDPIRLFYINIEMPRGTPLDKTLDKVLEVEDKARRHLQPVDLRSMIGYAGQMFTETAPFQGDHYGQILVALKPRGEDGRGVDELVGSMRDDVIGTAGPVKIYFLTLAGGPPTGKPISIKVRGDDLQEVRDAAAELKAILQSDARLPPSRLEALATDYPFIESLTGPLEHTTLAQVVSDVSDDDSPGQMELVLKIDHDAVRRAGLDPLHVARTVQLLVDGEVAADLRDEGEKLEVRVRARPRPLSAIGDLLQLTLAAPDGARIQMSELVHAETKQGLGNIRHYNFRRAITVEGEIDNERSDTVTVNAVILDRWNQISKRFPDIDLDFSGELDDIGESINAILVLFLLGLGLIYLILGTQFRSYFQPLLVLTAIPLAFVGVVVGLLISDNPLSLFTMYGVVALAGIAVNSAIVLISAANARLRAGMSVLHATIYAARRRVVPVLITSLTTIAGLFSLATGLGGHSLLWGPVANAIVWGLLTSTALTLFVIPLLFRMFMGDKRQAVAPRAGDELAVRRTNFAPLP